MGSTQPPKMSDADFARSLAKLREEDAREEEQRAKWDKLAHYDPELLVIRLYRGYEVDLETVTTPGELVEWIAHLSQKDWFDHDTLEAFMEAMDTALRDRFGISVHDCGRVTQFDWITRGVERL